MIIHQIFFKISDKTFDDYPCYAVGMSTWKKLCEEQGWEHRLHTEPDKSIMTEEEIKIMEEGEKRYPFFKIDYYRLILLSKYGGMYVDLDVIFNDNFKSIMNNEILIGRSIDKGDNKFYPNNNLMKLPIETAIKLKEYSHQQYYEKIKIKAYDTWRIRFFLQVVSARMLARFCKINKIPFLLDFDSYFIDYNTHAWDKKMIS